jgi:hypothetical protein
MKTAQSPSSIGFSQTSGTVRPLNHVEKKAQIKALAKLWRIPYREMCEMMAKTR